MTEMIEVNGGKSYAWSLIIISLKSKPLETISNMIENRVHQDFSGMRDEIGQDNKTREPFDKRLKYY
jgi:hypothetical protein